MVVTTPNVQVVPQPPHMRNWLVVTRGNVQAYSGLGPAKNGMYAKSGINHRHTKGWTEIWLYEIDGDKMRLRLYIPAGTPADAGKLLMKQIKESEQKVVLFVNRFESRCGVCGKPADPHAHTHDYVLGYGPQNGTPGCGQQYTHVSSDYTDIMRQFEADGGAYGLPVWNWQESA